MSYPVGITTRVVRIPGSRELVGADNLIVEASVKPSRGLSRVDGSGTYESVIHTYKSVAGQPLLITLPVSDQAGWADRESGAEILLTEPNSHTHTVSIRLRILSATSVDTGLFFSKLPLVLPTGDLSTVDIDQLIDATSVLGEQIVIPWAEAVADAQQAKTDAEAARDDAEAAKILAEAAEARARGMVMSSVRATYDPTSDDEILMLSIPTGMLDPTDHLILLLPMEV